jgi:hypothetical protein
MSRIDDMKAELERRRQRREEVLRELWKWDLKRARRQDMKDKIQSVLDGLKEERKLLTGRIAWLEESIEYWVDREKRKELYALRQESAELGGYAPGDIEDDGQPLKANLMGVATRRGVIVTPLMRAAHRSPGAIHWPSFRYEWSTKELRELAERRSQEQEEEGNDGP